MKNYRLVNNIAGWVTFVIASVVYLMTIEPTASFWDCGEFISSAYKLEVGHPPGAPFFMLTANLFSQLASDPSTVAKMVNSMSALFSGLTILFLFWSITHLAKKVICKKEEEISLSQMIVIFGSGLVGALVYTFSDTFWFSAVEGEVYAYSSLFTAVVFWLILKWETVADKPHADKWIILIAYLMGLSIGIHLLNLLCIPAIVLVYYFKKYPNPNLKGTLIALLISFVLVALILYGFVRGLVEVASWFELLFVNVFGFSYNSGVLFYIVLVLGVLAWSIWETMRDIPNNTRMKVSFILAFTLLGIPFIGDGYLLGIIIIIALSAFLFMKKNISISVLNTSLICMLVLMIGYSSYTLIMIRSAANTPMDQNSPEDIFTLGSYLGREQYGDSPLFYGETYASELKRKVEGDMCVTDTEDQGPIWSRIIKKDSSEKDHYYVSNRKTKGIYMDEFNMLFPRMYSKEPSHIQAYKDWADIKGIPVSVNICGNERVVYKPTFIENMRFFINYQLKFMYWRYFMWNFSGRQNDIQGRGDVANGNWITGIKFIDEILVGPQDNLPDDIINNKGHNKYYMLPFLLGILGLCYQVFSGEKGVQGFWITFFLFFMTGIAIVIYLNQTPFQPRERDYAYAGSFYAYCIWIGLGVAGLAKLLTKYAKASPFIAGATASVFCLFIPIQMASENWDDHDRSNRYVCRDFGFNYLMSCEPNSIIFTNGDNDTFPLWYAQEVEGFRTDVRVCNLSYLQTDWYIDQMKRQAYESVPLPISWKRDEYVQGTHDVAYIYPLTDKPIEVGTALDFIKSDDERFKKLPGMTEKLDILPSAQIVFNIDSISVLKGGIVKPENAKMIQKEMIIDLKGKNYIAKHEMMILDMLKNADWQRPIYYAVTVGTDQQLRLQKYFRLEGLTNRIVPFDTEAAGQPVETDIMFDNMMNKFKWGGVDNPKVYLDENIVRMAKTYRYMFARLVNALIVEGKNDKALQALDYCQKVLPPESVPYDYSVLSLADGYQQIGQSDKAIEIYEKVAQYSMKNLNWCFRLKTSDMMTVYSEIGENMRIMEHILSVYQEIKPELFKKYIQEYSQYSNMISPPKTQRGGSNK